MYPVKIVSENYRAFVGMHQFEFRPGTWFVLGENRDEYSSNGSGKTNTCSLVPWAQYGRLSTGVSKDEIITWGAPNVKVTLQYDTGLVIERSKTRGKSEKLVIIEDGVRRENDLAVQQEYLNSLIGIGPDLFFNCFWLDRESRAVQFVFAQPSKRQKILEEILTDGVFGELRTFTHTQRVQMEQSLALVNANIQQLQVHIKSLQDMRAQTLLTYEQQKHQISQAEGLKRQRIAQVEQEIAAYKERFEQAERERKGAEEASIRLGSVSHLHEQAGTMAGEIKRLEKALGDLDTGPKVCPTCRRPFEDASPVDNERQKKHLQEELLLAQRTRNAAYQKINEINAFADVLNQKTAFVQQLREKITLLHQTLNAVKETVTSTDALQESAKRLKQLGEQIATREAEKIQAAERQKDLALAIPRFKFWEEGFGSSGIHNLLLDDLRGLLEFFVVKYRSEFRHEQTEITFPRSSMGFEMQIKRRGKIVPIESCSPGEVWRTNLAVLFALRRSILSLAKTNLSFVCLDDPAAALDSAGVDVMVDFAKRLSKSVSLVLVTLPQYHDDIEAERIIRVVKANERSRVVR